MKPKVIVTSVLTIIVLLAGFFFFRFYFVFGKGVKAGELNQVVYKGYVFKTYEGRIIQAGFRGGVGATVQSYQFDFSVEDKEIADSLMKCSGKQVQLEYKEYFGSLPWRGQQKYIVDKIISVK